MHLEQGALADLVDVGAVAIHAEGVSHDVAVAHAELRFTGRTESNVAVGKIERIDVRYTPRADVNCRSPVPSALIS